jgi:hypothetical protein
MKEEAAMRQPAAGDVATTPQRRSPWVVGIFVMFAIVVLVNAVFIYVAVKGADQVVPSYITEGR